MEALIFPKHVTINWRHFFCFVSVLPLLSCAHSDAPLTTKSNVTLERSGFASLPGWSEDDQRLSLPAFKKSCDRVARADPQKPFFSESWAGTYAAWQRVCAQLPPENASLQAARGFYENNFNVFAVTDNGNAQGKFTGYFEASLKGSLTQGGSYQIPLRAKPDDLVMVDLGEFRDELKGQRIAGRVTGGKLKPYEERAAIEEGKLPPGQDKPILWVDSAVDAFFLQIQGSGIVTLPDGTTRRVGYDGQNGHPYYAIGKELVKRGHLKQQDVSMDSIKDYLAAHPDEGREIMRLNKSYVFFKLNDQEDGGPKGGEGVSLTPGRSLAIDRSLLPYGAPLYLQTEQLDLHRLMIAQDTGGAIRGAVRGDIFFGFGEEAEKLAGPMNSKGRYWILLPK